MALFCYPFIYNFSKIKENNTIINQEFVEKHENIDENTDYNVQDIDIPYEFEGYLEVPKYNIRRIIKKGNTNEILAQNYVLYYNSFVSLDKNDFNIVLLGHNYESVFRFLHYLDINDEIILVTNKACYIFNIYSIDIVPETSTFVMREIFDQKTLTLITCMKNAKNRLVLHAKLKNM